MSNRIFQGLVHQMREAVGRTLGVIDETGTIIACSELSKIGEVISTASDVFADNELHYINGYTFCNFGTHIQTEYAVFVEGVDELAGRFAAVCCVSLENLKQYYNSRINEYKALVESKDLFIKRLDEMINDKNEIIASLRRIIEESGK